MKKVIGFVKNLIAEIRLTTWLTPKATFQYSMLVILASIALELIILIEDFGFINLRNIILNLSK